MTKTANDSETPAHGQQVITACAFIHHDFDGTRKLFMPKRAATKKFLPNVYELPGGHVDFGEDIVAALQREITEEFSTTIKVGDAFAAFTYLNDIKGSHSVEIVFFAQFNEPIETIRLNPEDHSEYHWYSQAEFAQVVATAKTENDPELRCIQKGFSLLAGEQPDF
jgi:8-oxo-dGTP pyrophosphatase MutT (NUDIX family)